MTRSIIIVALVLVAVLVGGLAWEGLRGSLFGGLKTEELTTHRSVLEEIEALGKVELVKYKFKDVVEHKVKYNWFPDSKVMLIVSGEAVGCIDLAQIKPQHLLDTQDTLFLTMPAPELCYYKINHQDSKIYDTKNTYFNDAQLIDKAFKAAEKEISRLAYQANITEMTIQNADKILKPLLAQIAGKVVVLNYPPNAVKDQLKDRVRF
jgi:hypothetical protein